MNIGLNGVELNGSRETLSKTTETFFRTACQKCAISSFGRIVEQIMRCNVDALLQTTARRSDCDPSHQDRL